MISNMRTAVSSACACCGVLLLVFAGTAPADWFAAEALFAGLALLLVAHALDPCLDRMAVWRKQLLK